jgi:hypothetical protein
MRSILSLIVGLTAVIALNLATPADAQRSQRSQSATSSAAKQRQAPNNASRSYGQASGSSGSANSTGQQSGQCYIPTDVNNLGYWGSCTTTGAHQSK